MNHLDPDLKRLMKWAQRVPDPDPAPAEVPFGFSSRVVARWHPDESPALFAELQRALPFAAWISGAVIIVGVAFFVSQQQRSSTADTVVTSYQVLAKSIVP